MCKHTLKNSAEIQNISFRKIANLTFRLQLLFKANSHTSAISIQIPKQEH